jgi:uncharacterized membrane protein YbaN (DUF454 family)
MTKTRKSGIISKFAFVVLGLISACLGIIGVWLPGLPTTVFLLVALWAFSRSSPRLHKWLSHLPILRSALNEARRYEKERTISPATKVVSQSSAWISAVTVTLVTQNGALGLILITLSTTCSIFMYYTPSTSAIEVDE